MIGGGGGDGKRFAGIRLDLTTSPPTIGGGDFGHAGIGRRQRLKEFEWQFQQRWTTGKMSATSITLQSIFLLPAALGHGNSQYVSGGEEMKLHLYGQLE